MEDLRAAINAVLAGEHSRNVRCTAHEDRCASLSVSLGNNGAALIKCHAKCDYRMVLKAAGLTPPDLYPPSSRGRRRGSTARQEDLLRRARAIMASMLPAGARHVAITMATYADRDGGNIYPGVDRLCRDTGLSRAAIMRAQRALRDEGVLEVTRPGGGRGKPTIYRLVLGGNQERSHTDTVSSPNGLRIAGGPRFDPHAQERDNAWVLAWSELGNRLTSDPRVQVRTPDVVRGDEKKDVEPDGALF